jgi:hypothetical protein
MVHLLAEISHVPRIGGVWLWANRWVEDDSKLWAMKQHDEPYLGVEFHFVIDLQSHNYGANIPTYDGCFLPWLYKVYVPSNETN